MFADYYPNSTLALVDEAVGVATVEVEVPDPFIPNVFIRKSFTYVAGTKALNATNSVLVVLRYEHNPGVVTTPLVAVFPSVPKGIGGVLLMGQYQATCMAVHVDPADLENVRVVVAAVAPGLQGTTDIKVVAFNRDLGLEWTNTYSWDGGFSPPWHGDDAPVAMDIGLNVVAVVGTSQSNPGTGMGTDMVTLCYRHSDGMGAMPVQRFATVNNEAAIDVEVTSFPNATESSPDLVFALGQVTSSTTGLRTFATTVYPAVQFPAMPATYFSGITGRDNVPVGIAFNGDLGTNLRIAIGGTTYPEPSILGDADYFTQVFEVYIPGPLPAPQVYILDQKWTQVDDGGFGNDEMSDIAMLSTAAGQGGDGSTSWVWVTGKSDQASAGKAIRTLQYDDRLIGGPRTWQALWNRPGNTGSFHDDEGLRITPFARAGQKSNIYVAGRTQNDSGNWDLVALRYSETDPGFGVPKPLIWDTGFDVEAPIYASPANGDEFPAGIAAHRIFTSSGEKIFFGLGGRSIATSSNVDMLTTVYEDSHTSDGP